MTLAPLMLAALEFLQRELLLLVCVAFLVSAMDDLLFDGLWIAHRLRRQWRIYRHHRRATVESLPAPSADRPFAIFVPAWQEAPVIGTMIRRCIEQWDERHFRLYVGCYPNDEPTIAAACHAAAGQTAVRIVVGDRPGPTSKADCLNRLWRAACQDELFEAKSYRAIILQDAEDLVHPGALVLFGHLIERADLVQLPVIPRRARRSRWVAGHYGDEFAELHGKQMVLREALGASMPAAGVGCAFRRSTLGDISVRTGGKPFSASSLTEDYELGVAVTAGDARGIFARLQDDQGQWVATQEFFPDRWHDAVRQKSRWITGIALSGWDRIGWQSGWRENWMLLRDRKSSLSALMLALAYLLVLLTLLLWAGHALGLHAMQPLSRPLTLLLAVNAMLMSWRLAFRAFFVFRLYGLREALWSVPRTVTANLINIFAAARAFRHYFRNLRGAPLRWEKTRHFHPDLPDIEAMRPQGHRRPDQYRLHG